MTQFVLKDIFLLCVCVCVVLSLSLHHSSDIQEFYELTLLDDTKSVQQKTAETLQMASKWETGQQQQQQHHQNEPLTITAPIRSEVIDFYYSLIYSLSELDSNIESSLTNRISLWRMQCVHCTVQFSFTSERKVAAASSDPR